MWCRCRRPVFSPGACARSEHPCPGDNVDYLAFVYSTVPSTVRQRSEFVLRRSFLQSCCLQQRCCLERQLVRASARALASAKMSNSITTTNNNTRCTTPVQKTRRGRGQLYVEVSASTRHSHNTHTTRFIQTQDSSSISVSGSRGRMPRHFHTGAHSPKLWHESARPRARETAAASQLLGGVSLSTRWASAGRRGRRPAVRLLPRSVRGHCALLQHRLHRAQALEHGLRRRGGGTGHTRARASARARSHEILARDPVLLLPAAHRGGGLSLAQRRLDGGAAAALYLDLRELREQQRVAARDVAQVFVPAPARPPARPPVSESAHGAPLPPPTHTHIHTHTHAHTAHLNV